MNELISSTVAAEIHNDVNAVEMTDLLEAFDIEETGFALFDRNLHLLSWTPLYGSICGYAPADMYVGVGLEQLAQLSLRRAGIDENWVNESVTRGLARLRTNGSTKFRFATSSGKEIVVARSVLADGRLFETVREATEKTEGGEQNQLALFAKAARNRLSHALEAMDDGFVLFDENDRLVLYNRQFVDLNPGIGQVVAPGRTFEELMDFNIAQGNFLIGDISPERYREWRLDRHRNPSGSHDLEMTDGRWVRIRESRTHDGGTVAMHSDITELKRNDHEMLTISDELRRRNMMFDTALNNMTQGLCMFDPKQRLIVCNTRYLKMYGFSPDVVKPGILLPEIMEYSISLGNYSREDAARALEERPDQATSKTQNMIKQFLRDGRVIAVLHEPMPDGGSIATYQDITELENHERSRAEYTKRLEASNRELQDFAYVASHDLQEPLRKIETFGDRLKSKYGADLDEGAINYIERMQNATSRMRLLISDLLTYSRVTSQAKPFVTVDLQEQAEIVLSDLSIRVEELDAEVVFENLPKIEADPVQIRQVLQNLMGNALKFQKPGVKPLVSVTAEVTPGDFATQTPGICTLRIKDNGIGFEQKYKDQIFTIFQRLHGRNEYEGTGIGLATVRKIVERHGGSIDAVGVVDEGATFIVELPVEHYQLSEGKIDND